MPTPTAAHVFIRSRNTLAALLIAGAAAKSLAAQQAPRALPSNEDVQLIVKQRIEEKRSAGIVVGLLEPNGHTRFVAMGDAGPGQPALDDNTVFEIGSITKVFTATVLAQLVQEGKVSLDDPAQKYLPASVHLPMHNGKAITLGQLSEQNSGLPRMPSNFHPADAGNPYADYSVAQMYEFLSGYQLPRDPGQLFEYSNLGVGLLGHILTLVTGTTYEQMVHDRIWAPLGMTHTAITLTPWMQAHLALGHDANGKVVPNWDLPALAGAGAIRSTAQDMLRFADANLHAERGPLQQAMAFAHTERAPAGAPALAIGLNWISLHVGADTIVWHNGGTGGYRTYLGMVPSQKTAVVVLTNSGGEGADDIGAHLLVPALPLTPKAQPVKQHVAIDVPVSTLSAYVGTYELAPSFFIEITLENGVLVSQATGQPKFRLWAETEVDFFVKEFDAQLTFSRDAAQKVTGLTLHQGGQNPVAMKVK